MKGTSKIIILSWFILAQLANLFLPENPVWDENLFLGELMRFGEHYFPTLDQIRDLQSPMGPVYFILYGFIGKLTGFSLFWMRSLHLVLGLCLLLIVDRLLKKCRQRTLLVIIFILNPYFLVMTAPLLYTDVIGLLFVFAGLLLFLENKNFLLAGILWGFAICTRQLFMIVPFAALAFELYHFFINKKVRWRAMPAGFIPFLIFLPLFVLWNYNLNSAAFGDGRFEENTPAAFSFSLKTFNYSLILIGIYAIPVLYRKIAFVFRKPSYPVATLALILCIAGFPVNVNSGMQYGNLPDTAGLLDILFNKVWYLRYLLVPALLYWGLLFMIEAVRTVLKGKTVFLAFLLFLFIVLETVYSYCWDKHFILVIPIVFIISEKIKKDGFKLNLLKVG